jgi:glycosyltransferase involved in cell wall biosynthesis
MRIHAHILAWNEADIIPFTIKHYQKFCDKITVHDNYSDDGTPDIARSMGCNVREFGIRGVLDDKEYLRIKNLAWKGSTADFVIMVDCDEILWHPNMHGHLIAEQMRGTTVFNTFGVNIYANKLPVNDWTELMEGVPNSDFSKKAMFSPNISSIWYEYGAHRADPRGHVIYSDNKMFLLHYRNAGGVDRLVKRHELYRKRLSKINKAFKLGSHYLQSDEERIKYFNDQMAEKRKVDISWLV